MFGAFDVSTSALTAQRMRLDTISSNIANINTTSGPNGQPYRRLAAIFQSQQTDSGGVGVQVSKIVEDQTTPLKARFEPSNPSADGKGFVYYPNVDLSTEMVNAIEATRAYEANITAIETTKSMMNASLRVLA